MKRDIEWKEMLEGGVKRTVRIHIQAGKVKWQFKRSDEERWDYDTPPSSEDWEALETKMDQLYHRRRASYKDFELVREMREKHG
ncbi:MAG: hypothetical protein PWQ29_1050 [Verrucomicrobiota bacterium]|jgi:hypothetical protein|nr:hypothetical protein [Verrucomicrobiota bacterium]MDK2963656.1 hypothetical protein [Verrucomicrobiota bacterium]